MQPMDVRTMWRDIAKEVSDRYPAALDLPVIEVVRFNLLDDFWNGSMGVTAFNTMDDARPKGIYLNERILPHASREEIEEIVRHEMAHGLVGPGDNHGGTWLKMAQNLGATRGAMWNLAYREAVWNDDALEEGVATGGFGPDLFALGAQMELWIHPSYPGHYNENGDFKGFKTVKPDEAMAKMTPLPLAVL